MSATQQPRSPLPEFTLDLIPSRNENRTNPFYRLPKEVVCMVFANMRTWRDFKAAAATCRQARAITRQNEQFIACTWIDNMLPPSVRKLGIMAVASRKFDKDKVEEFIEKYISHEGDYPPTYKSMEVASALPDLIEAAEMVMRTEVERSPYPCRYPSYRPTPAEHAREMRACFMIETARNLFDGSKEDSDEEGFGEKKRAYWTAFSKAEVQAARAMFDGYDQIVFEALRYSRRKCCVWGCHLSDEETRSFAQIFSIEVGLVQIQKWYAKYDVAKSSDVHASFHRFESDRSGQREGYQHFDEFLENEDTVFAQFPFQPDPKAINLTAREEFFESNEDEIKSYLDECSPHKVLSCQMFWDQDTFTAWERQFINVGLDQWNEPAAYESESEPDEREAYDSDDYDFESVGDREIGEELWYRWRDSSTTMGFQEWMDNEKMCREEDSEDEYEYESKGKNENKGEGDGESENEDESENGDENENENEGEGDDEDDYEDGYEGEDEGESK